MARGAVAALLLATMVAAVSGEPPLFAVLAGMVQLHIVLCVLSSNECAKYARGLILLSNLFERSSSTLTHVEPFQREKMLWKFKNSAGDCSCAIGAPPPLAYAPAPAPISGGQSWAGSDLLFMFSADKVCGPPEVQKDVFLPYSQLEAYSSR